MKIIVIGLGFVGLTLSSVLASKGITTVGIDLDKEKCSKIKKGSPTFFEPNLKKTLKKALNKKFIIDCRRVLAKKVLDAEYHAIGLGQKI